MLFTTALLKIVKNYAVCFPLNIESCTHSIMCCLIESPSSLIGQFHRKNASRVPKSPGLSLGTREWSCPGMLNETDLSDKICVQSWLIQRAMEILTQRNTSEGFWSSNRTEKYQINIVGKR